MTRLRMVLVALGLILWSVPASAQITILRSYSGSVTVNGITTTSTDGIVISNTTLSTAGATVQISPRIRQSGTGWDSDDSVSRTVSFFTEALPATGTTVTGAWKLGYIAADGTTTTYPMTVTPTGGLTLIDNSSAFVGAENRVKFFMSASTGVIIRNWADTAYLPIASSELSVPGANGQSLALKQLSELTTIAAAATTDTTIQMPANAIVLAVSVRVTTVIPTAATFTVGDSGSAARFNTAAVSTAATSTDPGTKAGAYYNASALAIRITPNAQPADNTGRVRVTIYYLLSTPPTS